MVNKASISGKNIQFHINSTLYCGFNQEMNRLKVGRSVRYAMEDVLHYMESRKVRTDEGN
jgi:hypothetical protein